MAWVTFGLGAALDGSCRATGTGVGVGPDADRTATLLELVTPVDDAVRPPATPQFN